MTLDGSDNDKIQPQALTTPVVVPCWADLTTAGDAFNNFTAEKVEIQSDWDDGVNNESSNQQNEVAAYEESDLMIEAHLDWK